MDLCLPLRMKELLWIVFLLKSTSIMWLQGDIVTGADHHLQCVTDYLFTLNCSLDIKPSENTSYWLKITETFDHKDYLCLLTNTSEGHFCSIRQPEAPDPSDMFTDLNMFEISLCQSRDEGSPVCELLDDQYEPVNHIKPNAPCCLTISHNSTQNHFIWKSTYEEYSSSTGLTKDLQYQLGLYRTQDKQGIQHINTKRTSFCVDEDKFVPDTEYAARVRSSPGMNHYRGQWSDWSSEVLWRTGSVIKGYPTNTSTFELCVGFAALFIMVVLILLLCYGPIKVWRQRTFIPTPAPYFHSLYKDYQGDFKSWVVTQENTDALKEEETLQIDTMVKFAAIQCEEFPPMFEQQVMEARGYSNIPASDCDADLSILYTDSSEGWLSGQGSSGNAPPAWSASGSPAEDSGCWLCSDMSLEKEPPWYCNEYCTLSCFQQSGCHSGAPWEHSSSQVISMSVAGGSVQKLD